MRTISLYSDRDSSMSRAQGFAPVANSSATRLILGSMPGVASLQAQAYYAHPRNAFWRIQGELIGAYPQLPYEQRLLLLHSAGIALWDVLASCLRAGSLDADIDEASIIVNDFQAFFIAHPHIDHVYFNGAKAEQCFKKYAAPTLDRPSLHYQRLPSTSPAHAGMSFEQKLAAWRVIVA